VPKSQLTASACEAAVVAEVESLIPGESRIGIDLAQI
jgi:hypothetical protein